MMTTETTTVHATETSRFDKPDSKLYNVEASAEHGSFFGNKISSKVSRYFNQRVLNTHRHVVN